MYTCPKCGPVKDALYGDDEQFHCSSLDCDEVVHILSEEERNPPKADPAKWTNTAFDKPSKPSPTKPRRASNELSGKEILARMEARERARKNGRTTPPKGDKLKEPTVAKNKSSRHGTCSGCNTPNVWLLAKDPPRCAACYRGNPTGPSEPKQPKPKRTPVAKTAPKKKRQARRKNDSSITREVNAIEQVAEAVDELTPQEIQRVFGYVAMRYAQTKGVAIQSVQPLALGHAHMLEG